MLVVNTSWFTELGSSRPIGMISCIDEFTDEYVTYIGTAQGYDEKADTAHIISHGAKLHGYMIFHEKPIFKIDVNT